MNLPSIHSLRRLVLSLLTALAPLFAGTTFAEGTVTNCTAEALQAAMIGGGVVRFECSGTIRLTESVTISRTTFFDAGGREVTLGSSSTNLFPLFTLNPGVTFGLNGVRFVDGRHTQGAAIFNQGGTLLATNCAFSANTAVGTDGTAGANGVEDFGFGTPGGNGTEGSPGRGGALFNAENGEVVLIRCQFAGNRATGGKGGNGGNGGADSLQGGDGGDGGNAAPGWGAAIFNAGSLLLDQCTFTNNVATGGVGGAPGSPGSGAFSAASGRSGSSAHAAGGALYNLGQTTITTSTFAASSAQGGNGPDAGVDSSGNGRSGSDGAQAYGGAVFNEAWLAATNCTFYTSQTQGGNGGKGGAGGLIGGDGGSGGDALGGTIFNRGSLTLTSCTLAASTCAPGTAGAAGNGFTTGEDGSPGQSVGANLATEQGTLTLRSCILATDDDLAANAVGPILDDGYNLSSDATPAFQASTSFNNLDPQLGTIGNYGNNLPTLPLQRESPAIDRGSPHPPPTLDQRGVVRPQGPQPDIGAYERRPTLVSGQVIDGFSFRTNATVILATSDSEVATTTDTQGRYAFTNLSPGVYQIRLENSLRSSYFPNQQSLFLNDLSEGESNFDFYQIAPSLTGQLVPTNLRYQLNGAGAPRYTYRIETTSAIGPAALISWQLISTVQADTIGKFQLVDTNAPSFPRRFYRATLP